MSLFLFEICFVHLDLEKSVFHEQEANKEICQKCKIDYVDKK